jgi:glycine/D-amino acid oxidase-like deaminating enzyme
MKRRDVLKMSMLAPAAAVTDSLIPPQRTGPRVAVIGAGAFGGWTALELTRRGARVALVDAWGPGNARASSGGETRVIRATYGSRVAYTDMAARALALWRAYDQRWQRTFFRQTGALWMFGRDDSFGRASRDALRSRGMQIEELSRAEAVRRYPQVSFEGIESVLFEPDAGYLLARRACEHVVERVIADGGTYRVGAAAAPVHIDSAPVRHIALDDGQRVEADHFVFACGPWLGVLFPNELGSLVKATKQEVYYFGTPPGDDRFSENRLPVWVDFRDRLLYGIPGNANRGFKLADDTSGPAFDPTNGERDVSEAGIAEARKFVAERFPALARAPLVGSEVCQYESTPDSNFMIDHHPAAANVWIAGGGSGHGYKMGPVIGEMVASLVLGEAQPVPMFALRRFATPPPEGWQEKWS